MNVTVEDAYREACTALGEATVRERLLSQELNRRDQEAAQAAAEAALAEAGVQDAEPDSD